jgi:hypothetical protein
LTIIRFLLGIEPEAPMTVPANQTRTPPRLDEDEVARRTQVIEEAIGLYAELGYRLDGRCAELCEAYRTGKIGLDELRREIIRPYVC